MNKLLYIFLIIFLLQSTAGAQSYTLSWEGVELEEEVLINGNPDEEELLCYMNITNNSSDADSIKVKRVLIDLAEGANHLMCWGSCYPPNSDSIFISHLYIVLQPGETSADHEFSGHYLPNGTEDNSIVEYTFFNMNDESESTTVRVNYNTVSTSIDEKSDISSSFSLYPNPANNYLNISSVSGISFVEMYNLSGQLVKSLSASQKSLVMDVSDLNKAIYLVKVYSQNGVFTKKLIIN